MLLGSCDRQDDSGALFVRLHLGHSGLQILQVIPQFAILAGQRKQIEKKGRPDNHIRRK